jgi:hypothetical protein
MNAYHNCTTLQYLKEATRMKFPGLLREIDPSPPYFLPHTTPGAVSLGMFCHPPYNLDLSRKTLLSNQVEAERAEMCHWLQTVSPHFFSMEVRQVYETNVRQYGHCIYLCNV